MRVKFIKDHKNYHKGDSAEVSRNVAFGLIDSGKAILSKDITQEEVHSGNTTILRSHKRKRR